MSTSALPPICCFWLARGACRGCPCTYRHAPDDGVTPCSFGATCRKGHCSRALAGMSLEEQRAHWVAFRSGGTYEGESPAARDATRLRSQLEPWPTAALRARLVDAFSLPPAEAEALVGRAAVMARLLAAYAGRSRRTLRVVGAPVRAELRAQLLEQLHSWAAEHTVNLRPSISATNYLILRSPAEFGSKDSRNAAAAAARIEQYKDLWRLAVQAIDEADPEFAAQFTALAVTRGFSGSPHIDKQNTGPFYGMALGDFDAGTGQLCVEVDAFTVAAVETKNALAKVDGRYPHWVAPYKGDRYSLIYYQTEGAHLPPAQAHFGITVDENEGERDAATTQSAISKAEV